MLEEVEVHQEQLCCLRQTTGPAGALCCSAAHFDDIPEGGSKTRTTLVCFCSDNYISAFDYGPLESRTAPDTMPKVP